MLKVLIYGMFWAFWRRLYGKGNVGIRRWIFASVAIAALAVFFYEATPWNVDKWLRAVFSFVFSVVIYGLYWSKGHGMIMDKGTSGKPTPELLKRYENMAGYRLACFLLPRKKWYGYQFDSLMMLVRYGVPAILVSVVMWNPWFLLTGLLPSPIYTFCLWLQRKKPQLFRRWLWMKSFKDLAEILTGAQFGLIYGFVALSL